MLISRERKETSVALTSTLHWFETQVLAEEHNDSSESPVHGGQEQSAHNGHVESVCYHPLFVFNALRLHQGWRLLCCQELAPTAQPESSVPVMSQPAPGASARKSTRHAVTGLRALKIISQNPTYRQSRIS